MRTILVAIYKEESFHSHFCGFGLFLIPWTWNITSSYFVACFSIDLINSDFRLMKIKIIQLFHAFNSN